MHYKFYFILDYIIKLKNNIGKNLNIRKILKNWRIL